MKVDQALLSGVWTRRWIRRPGAAEDAATRVWWLQGPAWYGDLRLPAERPSVAGVNSMAECNTDQAAYLRRQEGFCGILRQVDDAWMWERELDYQPPTGKRDIGTLAFQDSAGKLIIEEGVDEKYTELWERMDDAGVMTLLQAQSLTEQARLICVGGHFLLFVAALGEKPSGFEISHGRREGAIENWIITDSTHPWREGQRISPWNWREIKTSPPRH